MKSKYLKTIQTKIKNNDLSGVKKLLTKLTFTEKTLFSYSDIIYYASFFNRNEIVEYLIKNTDLNPAANKNSALRIACCNGNLELVKLLLTDKRVTKCGHIDLRQAVKNRHYNVVSFLINENLVNPTIDSNISLILAAESGCTDSLNLLLNDKRVNPTYHQINHAFSLACSNGFLIPMEILLKIKEINPNYRNNYALLNSSAKNFADSLEKLLSFSSVNPSFNNNEALILAAENGSTDTLKLLLNDSRLTLDINNKALTLAAENNHSDVFKLLLSDSRIGDSYYFHSLLILLIKNGNLDLVELLIEHKIMFLEPDINFFILACEYGHLDIIKLLLNKLKINISKNNESALFLASKNNHIDVVEFLITIPSIDISSYSNFCIKHCFYSGYKETSSRLFENKKVKDKLNKTGEIYLSLNKEYIKNNLSTF